MSLGTPPPSHASVPPWELALFDGDRRVGWIRGHVVGFSGFAHELYAARSAAIAHDALRRWEMRRRNLPEPPVRTLSAAVHEAGEHRTVVADGRIIGVIARTPPGDAFDAEARGVAFEIAIPGAADEAAARGAAHVAHRAIQASGLRWNAWVGAADRGTRALRIRDLRAVATGREG